MVKEDPTTRGGGEAAEPSSKSMSREFHTVDRLLDSNAPTRAVDAFILSRIKVSRQVRKLVTHLVFQSTSFLPKHIPELKKTLAGSRRVYLEGLVAGFDAISPVPTTDLIGSEHGRLWGLLEESTDYRRKIFHGQLTGRELKRTHLLMFVDGMREWCGALATSARNEVGYDGFERNSFRKSSIGDLYERLGRTFRSIEDYAQFIKKVMER